jgi:hypothetical protein
MNTEDPFDPKSLDLVPSREFDEAASLMAYGTAPRRPPAGVKSRLMKEIVPAPASWRSWAVPALAFAVLLLVPYFFFRSRPVAEIVSSSHGVAGETIASGQTITSPADGEVLMRVGQDAALKLSRGGEATITRKGEALTVVLKSGWLLSSVRHGQTYRVVTARGEVAALGTEFFVRIRPDKDYVCICKGRLRLSGAFPATEIAAEAHSDAWMDGATKPEHAAWSMEGHGDGDWEKVRLIAR